MAKVVTKKKKFTINFCETAFRQLDDIVRATGASSQATVVRDALSLYAFLVDQLGEGRKLAVLGQDEEPLKIIFVPGLHQ